MLLHRYAIGAMNYGYGSNIHSSGEKIALDHVAESIKKNNPVIFDVGANVGSYTLAVIASFKHNPSIYSFEPSAATFKKLTANTAGLSNVIVNHCALSSTVGEAVLYGRENNSEIASLVNTQAAEKYGQQTQETVKLNTLDNYCRENNIDFIDFLKIDTEGHELTVLQGATEMLQRKMIRFIQFEFGQFNIDSRTYFRDFWRLLGTNYTIYRIVKDGLFEIKKYELTLEIFLTSNFLAELKTS